MARRFTLLDDEYYQALRLVSAVLEREGLAYCLVGGGAAQAWIASLRTGDGERRVADEPVLARVLRRTRDLDFATRVEPAAMLAILNRMASSSDRAIHVLGPRTIRIGPVSVSFTLGPEDLTGMADRYDAFLHSRATLHLRVGTSRDAVTTIGLEELLATKLTRKGDKAKDILDLTQLIEALRDASRTADLVKVRSLLGEDREAAGLLDSIAEALR